MRGKAVLALAVAAAALGPGAGAATACDRWASTFGSDGAAGTATQPYRSLGRLLSRLAPGQTGCLAGGSVFSGSIRIRKRGVTLRTPAGRRAEIRGSIEIARGAHGVTLAALAVRGPRSGQGPIVAVRGHRARLLRNDVTGLATVPRGVTCVLLDGVRDAVVDGNAIHHCSRAAGRDDSIGVLALRTRGGRIANNFVYGIAGEGIALVGARGLAVHHNLVDGNVSGITLRTGALSNRIVSNIVSRAGRNLVRSTIAAPQGRSNLVAANCLWRGYGGDLAGAGLGFRTHRNLFASPRFVNRPRTFRLRPGPCFGKRPYATQSLRGAAAVVQPAPPPRARPRPRPRPVVRPRPPAPPTVLPAFRVRYRLLAYPRSVQVVALTLAGLSRSARVDVACLRGCRAAERVRAGTDGTAALARFRGSRLGRGTVIEARASRAGAIGHVARITITGLPSGVRIDHGCLSRAGAVVSCNRYR